VGWRASMVLLLMAMAFGVIALVPPVQDGDRGFGVNAIPASLAGWAATDGAPEEALPRDPNETVSFRRTYREGDKVAWVSVALFVRQDDPKRRPSLNLVHPEANAKRIEGMRVPISLTGPADTSVTLPAKVIHAGDGRLITVFTKESRKPDPAQTSTDIGAVHHIAFSVSHATFAQAVARLDERGIKHSGVDPYASIPRYALGKDGWVCLDRNPRQVHRGDCLPRQK